MRMFANRADAAEELARDLMYLKDEDPIIIGLPNGGIPIAMIIAERLDAPLDLLLFERLTAPRNPDHIVGAVDEHGRISVIQATARWHHVNTQKLIGPAREAFRDLKRRRAKFRAVIPEAPVRGRTVMIVSEGVSSGAVMLGAITSVRDRGAKKIIAVAPAGAGEATWQLREAADRVIIPHAPSTFRGIDKFYKEFPEVTDDMVVAILTSHVQKHHIVQPQVITKMMRIIADGERSIFCHLDVPAGDAPFPAVIFAHGFESNSESPRSIPISRRLAKRGIMGVRLDFTGHGHSEGSPEDATEEVMLSDLRAVYENLLCFDDVDHKRIGINGAGTGGMIALRLASGTPKVGALVIRGPILGEEFHASKRVEMPTLLIHAEHDMELLEGVTHLNEELPGTHRLLRIPESDRMFNDPISFELMVSASVDWFADQLPMAGVRTEGAAEAAQESS